MDEYLNNLTASPQVPSSGASHPHKSRFLFDAMATAEYEQRILAEARQNLENYFGGFGDSSSNQTTSTTTFIPPVPVLRYQSDTIGTGDAYGNDRCCYGGSTLFYAFFTQINAIDATDPTNPVILSSTDIGENVASVAYKSGNLFVVGDSGSLYTVSVSASTDISIKSTFDPGLANFTGWPWSVIKGNYLYTQGHYGGGGQGGYIAAYNISTPQTVTLASHLRTPNNSWGGGGVAIVDNTLWVADYFANTSIGAVRIHSIDITNPAAMSFINTYNCATSADSAFETWFMCSFGTNVYVMDDYVFQTWSAINPASATRIAVYDGDTVSNDVEGTGLLLDGYLFTGSSFELNLQVFSIGTSATPIAPTEINRQSITAPMGRGTDFDRVNRTFFCAIGGYLAIYTY